MTETPISRTIRRLFASGGAVGMALLAPHALAQEAAPAPQALAQEAAPTPQATPAPPVARVEVTGSNIRRAQSETASSVLTVNRADIERSGRQTVAELLQTLAVDNAGSVPTSFGNGFAAGASGVSLRGLGVASTLVLINGRRVAPYGLSDDGQKQFTDLNVIPADAVDRIEILLDGASAIYGSDAVAGVVNVILRRDFVGTTVRGLAGRTKYQDGKQYNVAFTHGVGDLDNDHYNAFFSVEYKKFNEIWYHERGERDYIGRIDLRPWGFSANEALGGTGAILRGSSSAGNAINGNVRNPATSEYYNRGDLTGDSGFTRLFPGAACQNFTNHPQGDPGGGCLIDSTLVYGQVLPKQENISTYARGTWKLPNDMEAFTEFNFYTSNTDTSTTPSAVSTSVGYPGGPVSNAGVQLGASHPDNPYFGTAARVRYLAADVGPRTSTISSNFLRWVAGLKGSNLYGWDWNAGVEFSHNHVNNDQNGYLQRDVAFALLDPSAANVAAARANSAAYRALPLGTVWRIGENAFLNSRAMYEALSPQISNSANTKLVQGDFRVTRNFSGLLQGGDVGVAAGLEIRHEMTELSPSTGTDRGNIIGLGFSAYEGSRNVSAFYIEGLAPVTKELELTAAGRIDHFTDVGTAYTPKLGVKYTPFKELALRGNWGHGFRAPSPAENGRGGLAAFSTASDPLRCALGVPGTCSPAPVALITSPNPNLSPERSTNWDLGVIWDPLPGSSLSVDLWRIKRRDEINQEQVDAAIASGSVARDPTTAVPGIPGDPGAITAVLVKYVNSAETVVKGVDIDGRQRFRLPHDYGSLNFDIKFTHFIKWLRTEQDGSQRDFAGTHGNCDVTNCVGTPRNRANFHATWERPTTRLTLSVNYRSKLQNVLFQGDPAGCASNFANGDPAPSGCELASFTTFDLVGRWKPSPRWEITATILNMFDKIPPLDPLTYGAQAYNPLDFDGARGRMYTLGARYTF
jgi:iron complex outermembrane receptor protein